MAGRLKVLDKLRLVRVLTKRARSLERALLFKQGCDDDEHRTLTSLTFEPSGDVLVKVYYALPHNAPYKEDKDDTVG